MSYPILKVIWIYDFILYMYYRSWICGKQFESQQLPII